jgi:hypothetical protein
MLHPDAVWIVNYSGRLFHGESYVPFFTYTVSRPANALTAWWTSQASVSSSRRLVTNEARRASYFTRILDPRLSTASVHVCLS